MELTSGASITSLAVVTTTSALAASGQPAATRERSRRDRVKRAFMASSGRVRSRGS